MYSILRQTHLFLLIFFIFHGVVYYLFPSMHYLEGGGVLSLLKYPAILLLYILILPFLRVGSGRLIVAVFAALLILFIYLIEGGAVDSQRANLIFTAIVPLGMIFYIFDPCVREVLRDSQLLTVSWFVLALNFLGMVYEVAVGGIFQVYSYSSLRAVGLFVNPNNTAMVVALLGVFLIWRVKSTGFKFLSFLLTIVSLILTGSKTGMLMFLVGIFVLNFSWGIGLTVLLCLLLMVSWFLGFSFVDVFLNLNLRRLDAESGGIRLNDWSRAVEDFYNSDLNVILFGSPGVVLVDNSYLDMMALMGGVFLIFFVCIQFFALVKAWVGSKILFVLLFMMFVSMLTTNTYRLWPVAYLYWALIGAVLFVKNNSREEF